MTKLYIMPGEKKRFGPVHLQVHNITCNKCGNQDAFLGKAIVTPNIVIERTGDKKYDVTEISYKSDESVDEVVERCARCNSFDLSFE